MKKTISITIENTVFHLNEDAYEVLEKYLSSVREHFSKNGDSKEILRDIEGRIAERFAESKNPTVSLEEVNAVISDMGTIDQFEDQENAKEGTSAAPAGTGIKKFYRDADNAKIAGICSGLGNYFNLDPLLFRIAFIILTIINGIGLLAYIVLWIAIPEAKTAAQKLAMKGDAVTLASMSRKTHDKSDKSGIIRRGAKFIERNFFPTIRIAGGLILTVIAFIAITALCIGGGIAAFGSPASFFDPAFSPLFSTFLFPLMIAAIYFALLIPLVVVGLCGISLLHKKNILTRRMVAVLAGVWFIALVSSGITAFHTGFKVADLAENDPERQNKSQAVSVDPFTKIEAGDGSRIVFVQGETFSVVIEGEKRSVEDISATVEEDTLIIKKSEEDLSCIFCHTPSPEITVTAPAISTIAIERGSRIAGSVSAENLEVILKNASRADLDIQAATFTLSLENASRAILSGTSTNASYTLKNASSIEAEDLHAEQVSISAENGSDAEIHAAASLNAEADNASSITYHGEPEVTRKESNGSKIEGEEKIEETEMEG